MFHLSFKTIYLLKNRGSEIIKEVQSGVIVLMMDASYLALKGEEILQKINGGMSVYVLKDDVKRRGIQDLLIPEVQVIDYEEFIDLVLDSNVKTLNL